MIVAAAALAGGAYAATQGAPSSRQAFLNDVAQRLHVTPAQLQAAIKGAVLDRLSAAVKAGKLTRAQADAIAQRIQSGAGPGAFFLAPRGGFFFRPRLGERAGPLGAAAKYLGLTRTRLLSELRSGRSLAQVARAEGKTTSGLEQAITAEIKSRLDSRVASGEITKSQEQQILSRLTQRLSDLVTAPPRPPGGALGVPPGPGAPPPAGA